MLEGEPEGPCSGTPPLKTKPDKTHCALISAETKTYLASTKVTKIFPCLQKASSFGASAGYRLLPDLPALGAIDHWARPASLAGISVLLVPH